MIILYFNVGRAITQKQKQEGWGAMVIKKLSLDLQNDLPKAKGFSERNIKFMHQFYNEYANDEKGKQPVSLFQVSWSHNIILIQKIKDPYLFDFVTMSEPFRERELELNLVEHMEKFLLELGS